MLNNSYKLILSIVYIYIQVVVVQLKS